MAVVSNRVRRKRLTLQSSRRACKQSREASRSVVLNRVRERPQTQPSGTETDDGEATNTALWYGMSQLLAPPATGICGMFQGPRRHVTQSDGGTSNFHDGG